MFNLSVEEMEVVNVALAAHVRFLRAECKDAINAHHPEGHKYARRLMDAEILWRRLDDQVYSDACIAHGKIDPEYSGF